MTPDGALRYLYGLQESGIKFGLSNVQTALAALGEPQSQTAFVHVGGTNGKGSVCAMVAEVFRRSGHKTGLYTSPHLSEFRERIQVQGRWLAASRLPALVSRVRRAAAGVPLTFFEFTTVMALLEFAARGVEIAALEVGMGGRLDATNVVRPVACVVTNVSLEHTQHLGRTLRLIAAEKAGIVKPGAPCLTAARGPALEVLAQHCRTVGAPLLRLGRDFRLRPGRGGDGERFDYIGLGRPIRGLRLGLAGRHQAANAALALAAAEVASGRLGFPLPEAALREALAEVSWPGRLERLGESPLLLLDGAHNPAGARALAAYLAGHARGRLLLVIGMLKDKDAGALLRPLLRLNPRLLVCAPATERALDPERLAGKARRLGAAGVEAAPSVAEALRRALALAGPPDTVCVCGSLYTVGEAREFLLARRLRAAC
jgi:dihydrofolate synthase/folylpolyglutamate synthase